MTDNLILDPVTTTTGKRKTHASCLFCGAGSRHTFTDLGMSPPCTLLDISDRSGLGSDIIKDAADMLLRHDLLKECPEGIAAARV